MPNKPSLRPHISCLLCLSVYSLDKNTVYRLKTLARHKEVNLAVRIRMLFLLLFISVYDKMQEPRTVNLKCELSPKSTLLFDTRDVLGLNSYRSQTQKVAAYAAANPVTCCKRSSTYFTPRYPLPRRSPNSALFHSLPPPNPMRASLACWPAP